MNEEPVQDSATPSHYAAYVAFDWADQKHDMRLLDAASRCQEHLQIEHSPPSRHDQRSGSLGADKRFPVDEAGFWQRITAPGATLAPGAVGYYVSPKQFGKR